MPTVSCSFNITFHYLQNSYFELYNWQKITYLKNECTFLLFLYDTVKPKLWILRHTACVWWNTQPLIIAPSKIEEMAFHIASSESSIKLVTSGGFGNIFTIARNTWNYVYNPSSHLITYIEYYLLSGKKMW